MVDRWTGFLVIRSGKLYIRVNGTIGMLKSLPSASLFRGILHSRLTAHINLHPPGCHLPDNPEMIPDNPENPDSKVFEDTSFHLMSSKALIKI